MNQVIRIFSILILIFSFFWLLIQPDLQPLLVFLIAFIMLIITFSEFDNKTKTFLTGLILLSSGIWIILDYKNVEPYIAFLSATLAYLNLKKAMSQGGTMLGKNNNQNEQEALSDELRFNQHYKELKQQWEGMNKRIEAITEDLNTTMDSERKYTLQQRHKKLMHERNNVEKAIDGIRHQKKSDE